MGALEAGLAAQVQCAEESMPENKERMGRISVHAMAFENRERGGRGGKGKMMTLGDMEQVSERIRRLEEERIRRLEDWAIESGYHLSHTGW